jgi:hypothetical protein
MKKYILIALFGIIFSTLTPSVFADIYSNTGGTGTINLGNSSFSAGANPTQTNSSFATSNLNSGNTGATAAASSGRCKIPTDIGTLFDYALCILDSAVVPFLIGLALILFLAGVVKFVSSGDNEEARQSGRNMMLFGIVALFVMVSIWGFVNILSRSFFGTDSTIQSLPRKSTTLFQQ